MTFERSGSATLSPLPLGPLPDNPLVSVLIANYNYGNYIGEAIESVLQQSYSRLEVIVCDDGSTDNSCTIVETFAQRDPRVTLIRQENSGQGAALAAAYERSSGQIICLLDSDDAFVPAKILRVVEAFAEHAEVGFIGHRTLRINSEGKPRGVLPLIALDTATWWGPTLLRNGGILRHLPSCSGLSLRREVSDEIFPLFQAPEVRGYFGDRVPLLVAPLITPVLVLPQPLTKYRLHGVNRSGGANMTVPFLERELHSMQTGWELQQRYLTATHPRAAEEFAPTESLLNYWLMRYMRACLLGSQDAREAHNRVIHHPEFQQDPWFLRWFWRWSIVLPRPLFQRAINVLMGAGAIKQLVARLAGTGI